MTNINNKHQTLPCSAVIKLPPPTQTANIHAKIVFTIFFLPFFSTLADNNNPSNNNKKANQQ